MHDVIGAILQAMAEMVTSSSPGYRQRRLLWVCAIFLVVVLVASTALIVWSR